VCVKREHKVKKSISGLGQTTITFQLPADDDASKIANHNAITREIMFFGIKLRK
jgi:hypothetical protein